MGSWPGNVNPNFDLKSTRAIRAKLFDAAWVRCVYAVTEHTNSLRSRLYRHPFADDIFKCIFLNENEWISPSISLKCVPKVRINNIPTLVLIMAWRRPGDKPLSEPMMVSLLTHICVIRPQWVNALALGKSECHFNYKIFQIIAVINGWDISCELALRWTSLDLTDDEDNIGSGNGWVSSGNKPLPKPMVTHISVAKRRH